MTRPTACVVGWPITHSRSPLIHRHWLQTYGIDGDYLPVALPPDDADVFFAQFVDGPFIGGNVTVPHKERAFAAAIPADAATEALGAANTLWIKDGKLLCASTDGAGFLANLDESAPGWSRPGSVAVVLGAGGAARAVILALLERGFDPVIVVNRTETRAEALAARFGKNVRAAPLSMLQSLQPEARLLVNATSLGMEGSAPLDIDLATLPDDAVVTDLVYAPLETDLLRQAKARGLRAVDGLGMLLHQAVPGFEKWFGVRPAVTPELRDLVVQDLTGR